MVRVKSRPSAAKPQPLHYVEPYFGGGSVFFRRQSGKSPIPYHGGKFYQADWLIELMPESVRQFNGTSELVNDLDGQLTNFFRVLQNETQFSRFERIIDTVPVSRNEWEYANKRLLSKDPVERAVGYFVRARQSRQGLDNCLLTPVRSRTRRGMQDQVSRWLSSIEGLHDVHYRLKRCFIENMDAIELIKREDSPHTFFYLDPPYHPDTRVVKQAYRHEYTCKDHLKLLYCLGSIKGKFLLSGYWSKEYEEACRGYGWKQNRRNIAKASSNAKTKTTAMEYTWRNYTT